MTTTSPRRTTRAESKDAARGEGWSVVARAVRRHVRDAAKMCGGGVARKLLRACLERERAHGMRTARLDATANNAPAIALYESEGFAQVGAGMVDVEI